MKGTDIIIEKDWPENFGRAWVELLESGVSEHARVCYVAMTSFGPGPCRAGQKSIMRRMGIKNKITFRAAQSELYITGWGDQIQKETATTPAIWRMHQKPVKRVPGVQGTHGTLGTDSDPGVGTVGTPKQEGIPKQEVETSTPSLKPSKAPSKKQQEVLKALPWIEYFSKQWASKMKTPWVREPGAVKEILALQEQGVDLPMFQAKVDAYLAMDYDPYVAEQAWALMVLLRWRWNKIRPGIGKVADKPELAI